MFKLNSLVFIASILGFFYWNRIKIFMLVELNIRWKTWYRTILSLIVFALRWNYEVSQWAKPLTNIFSLKLITQVFPFWNSNHERRYMLYLEIIYVFAERFKLQSEIRTAYLVQCIPTFANGMKKTYNILLHHMQKRSIARTFYQKINVYNIWQCCVVSTGLGSKELFRTWN